MRSSGVRVRAPGKVNLHLSVGDVRSDGYHELVTVFQAVDLEDEIVAEPAGALRVSVSGRDAAQLPTDERNLAWQAARLLAETAGIPPRVHLRIAKGIPLAGGMAGGSADAAAALLACARLWDLDAEIGELTTLAAKLGSDVVFPLLGRTAVGTGRGEVVEPVDCPLRLNWVFALADFGISAADAYQELDRQRAARSAPTPVGSPERLVAALSGGNLNRIAEVLGNDLQAAALSLAPHLQRTLDAGQRVEGVVASLISGSGPTCAFLCADAETATMLAATLEAQGVCRTARTATGPAPGASVVA